MSGNAVGAAFHNEFDVEQNYTLQELSSLFSFKETQATSMGVSLLMPKTLVTIRSQSLKGKKHIPVYGNNVMLDDDRKIICNMAEYVLPNERLEAL